ncbi:MAG: hypothetical protein ACLUFC_04975 [Anaerobutyricum hallii]|uniref:hypothetical protein n=1 Tax=Anaerobutyricum hallii TaxID=39488 RepID=UPI0039928179
MICQDVQMNDGKIFDRKEIEKHVVNTVNKFAEEELTYEQALIILETTKDFLKSCSKVQAATQDGLKEKKSKEDSKEIRSLEIDIDKDILRINKETVDTPMLVTLPGPGGWPLRKLFNVKAENPEEHDNLDITINNKLL